MPSSHTYYPGASAETLLKSLSAAAPPSGERGQCGPGGAGAGAVGVLRVPVALPLEESWWVSDGLCPAFPGGERPVPIKLESEVSVCGAHATPLWLSPPGGGDERAVHGDPEAQAPSALGGLTF